MMSFDHMRLVKRCPRELKRFRRREAWHVTAAAIVVALNTPTLIMMVDV